MPFIFVLSNYWMHSLQNLTCACYQHIFNLCEHLKDSRLLSWIYMVMSWKFVIISLSSTSHEHWTCICFKYLNSIIWFLTHDTFKLQPIDQYYHNIFDVQYSYLQMLLLYYPQFEFLWRIVLTFWISLVRTISIFTTLVFLTSITCSNQVQISSKLFFHGIIFFFKFCIWYYGYIGSILFSLSTCSLSFKMLFSLFFSLFNRHLLQLSLSICS